MGFARLPALAVLVISLTLPSLPGPAFAAEDGDGRPRAEDLRGRLSPPGPVASPRLACRLRGWDAEGAGRMDEAATGEERRRCRLLEQRIDDTLAGDPALARLNDAIAARESELGAANPAARAALAADDRRFRRGLMRDVFVTADDMTMSLSDRVILGEALVARLDALRHRLPGAARLAGRWANAAGTLEIGRTADGYGVGANLADPKLLAWTCEFDEPFRAEGDGAVYRGDGDERVTIRLEDGLLRVEHRVNAPSCGAAGRLTGTYFPAR